MATNLRLRPELEQALREEAERSKRSQQDVIRAALENYLRVAEASYQSRIRPPRTPFRRAEEFERLVLPQGMTSLDLLQRNDED